MLRYERVRTEDNDAIEVFVRDNLKKFARQLYYNPLINEKTIVKYQLNEVMEKLQQGVGFCVRSKSDLIALGIITPSEWDSHILGKKIGKLTLYISSLGNKTKPFLKKCFLEAEKTKVDAVFTRISMEEKDVLQLMLAEGAILGDLLLTFYKNLHKEDVLQKVSLVNKSDITFEEGKVTHEPCLRKITTSAYRYSHYFNDPNIPLKKAEAIYQEWISNSLKGYADYVIVARLKEKVVGYITIRIRNLDEKAIGVIDLIAVDENYRGQGIGKMLVWKGIEKVFNRVDSLYVSTQVSNIAALQLYQGLGFKAVLSEATLHIWLEHKL